MQENEVQTPDAAQSPQYLDGTLLSKMAHGGAAVLKTRQKRSTGSTYSPFRTAIPASTCIGRLKAALPRLTAWIRTTCLR